MILSSEYIYGNLKSEKQYKDAQIFSNCFPELFEQFVNSLIDRVVNLRT
jgi:hypothetical protein